MCFAVAQNSKSATPLPKSRFGVLKVIREGSEGSVFCGADASRNARHSSGVLARNMHSAAS